jgi:hypothetical protein
MLPKIDVPVFETKLISNGKAIKFRPFLIKEQKLFLMALQSDDEKDVIDSIKQVLTNCILTPDVDVNDLPSFDIENLFLQLRAKSVGEIVELNYTCNNILPKENSEETEETKRCGNVVKFKVNLTDIKPKNNPDHNSKIQLTEQLGIVMKYPNFNILEKFENYNDSDVFRLIADCIDYIYDADQMYLAKDSTKEELIDFIENLQQSDFKKIENFFQTMPKFEEKLHFKCSKCNYEEDINVQGVQSFFG